MRATGRRLGRIVGALDDAMILLRHYGDAEREVGDDPLRELLAAAEASLLKARNAAEAAAEYINQRDKAVRP